MPDDGDWDDHLFKGAAPYYQRGRLPYAARLGEALRVELGLDGRGTLVDFGSGPGTLAVPLAAEFETVLAVEPDPEMAAHGRRNAADAGVTNLHWLVTPAEDAVLEPASVDVAVFGQSYHWMNRPLMARRLRTALRPGGHLLLIGPGEEPAGALSSIPTMAVNHLIAEYLGDVRRAGRRLLPNGTPSQEEEILAAAGYLDLRQLVVDDPGMIFRSVPTLVAEVYSKSSSARHLFGDRIDEFDARLHEILRTGSLDGGYLVAKPSTYVRIWTNP